MKKKMTRGKPKRARGSAASRGAPRPSSPVCYADEMDRHYAGYLASTEVAALLDSLVADERGIIDKLEAALPRIKDDRLHAALKVMRGAHEANVARYASLIRTLTQDR
jgi:hypothetical protein